MIRKKTEPPAMMSKVGDDAVRAKTGKAWEEWFAALDREKAHKLDHQGIVAILSDKFGVPGWWSQMVAVTYEQARGLRVKHQQSTGYSISKSKTLAVPVESVFTAWSDSRKRKRWLGEAVTVTKATENKTIRIRWNDGSRVEVYFYPKDDSKTQVTVQHGKLASYEACDPWKAWWSQALSRLRQYVED